MTLKPDLYDRICKETGQDQIEKIVRSFYERAFFDGIIGHFFFNHNHEDLIAKQTAFAKAMLGGPVTYKGKPLGSVHKSLGINDAHFGRRQVIMREVLEEHKIPAHLAEQWLALEERLRPLITGGPEC
jgi:truncated hemoglobin YjbI